MTRWVAVDRWLKATVPDGKRIRFDNRDLAMGLNRHLGYRISASEASGYIQAYLQEQRQDISGTSYWLYRRGRTSNAVWIAGSRVKDYQDWRNQYVDDIDRRIAIAIAPDLDRLRAMNPKAREACDQLADALEELMVLLHGLNGHK